MWMIKNGNLLMLSIILQRLSGASLLILANKQDIKGALSPEEITKVRSSSSKLQVQFFFDWIFSSFLFCSFFAEDLACCYR